MESLDRFALDKLAALATKALRRGLVDSDRSGAVAIRRGGRDLISFCCNDYLGLTHHPLVVEAAIGATRRYGTGAAASRLVTGNHPLYAGLEARLARHRGMAAALVFGSGYLANISIIPALVGEGDLVLVDDLAHACILAGGRLSGARRLSFRHNDLAHLGGLLAAERGAARHCLIVTDRVFSMDGDLAPVSDLAALARTHEAWLMMDDAHGVGIFAPPDPADVPLQMGTLSKALGSYGGYVCGSAPVIDLLKSRARGFVYTTGLPPGAVAAASAALDLIEADPDWARSPLAKAGIFAEAAGLPTPTSQIVPLVIGAAEAALRASTALEDAGFLVTAIRPPTVPEGTARLRFTFSAAHTEDQVLALAAAVRGLL
jgi:8-amino-7-oxononanoate synthase